MANPNTSASGSNPGGAEQIGAGAHNPRIRVDETAHGRRSVPGEGGINSTASGVIDR